MYKLVACLFAAAIATTAPAATETITEHPYVTTAAEDERVRSYWTPERVAAIPGNPVLHAEPPPIPADEQPYGAEFASQNTIVPTVGRILSTGRLSNGTALDGSCTGTLLSTRSPDGAAVVVTAGHCIFGAPTGHGGAWMSNVLFVPAFRDGAGVANFTVHSAYASSLWVADPGFDTEIYDRAFLLLNPGPASSSSHAESVGQSIRFRDAAPEKPYKPRWLFGYPRDNTDGARDALRYGTPAFTGRRLAACSGTPTFWGPDPSMLQVACYMGGGASGGPIMEDYDPSTGNGAIVAVNTFGGFGSDAFKNRNMTTLVGTPVTDSFSKEMFELAQSKIPVLE
ncbi:V8-like Glu-specific endopeptidase [Cordyceps fumosorosea ARSEF 2679]|uniref:V8-like Glu-specific endopeptidase n=1 Tax=Cordyceps fumosorosea (strain ARSEF 2679) TaxID=1081104 RepID=A0A162JHG2_CORFA|nr:V8-like Glu-specific endopeptidase [Cordyceps fumosorosea ARSEF 2679]OAA69032.1 V8-like Glu-specific endopeptidase [Cordyceps fumosorosea ARSEF 2679]